MTALTHLATHATRFSGDAAGELSSVLLVASAVAMGAAGVGLIVLCAAALLRRRRPLPTAPWIAQALASPTLHTRVAAGEPVPATAAPLSAPAVAVVQPAPAPAPAPAADSPPPSAGGAGPTSTDPTLEMDLRAFASFSSTEADRSPIEPSPPSEPTQVMEGAPADVTREPITVHRSGTVPKADPEYVRTLASFSDGARRA